MGIMKIQEFVWSHDLKNMLKRPRKRDKMTSYSFLIRHLTNRLVLKHFRNGCVQFLRKLECQQSAQGHSSRSASTSEVVNVGISMELILKTADWSSATVFRKHYHKITDDTFSHSVLSVVKP